MFNPNFVGVKAIRWMPCINTTSNDIPGFAVMRITGVADPTQWDDEYIFEVDQPDGSNSIYAVNGPQVIKAQSGGSPGHGILSLMFPNFALYDSSDGTPAFGEIWGPKSGSWKLRKNYGGFKICGGTREDRVLVMDNPIVGWLGVLAGTLSYHGSAEVTLYTWSDSNGYFISTGLTDTCYPWLLVSGDSIPATTQVVGGFVDGKRVVFGAACNGGT